MTSDDLDSDGLIVAVSLVSLRVIGVQVNMRVLLLELAASTLCFRNPIA